jgi:hypothetical protein
MIGALLQAPGAIARTESSREAGSQASAAPRVRYVCTQSPNTHDPKLAAEEKKRHWRHRTHARASGQAPQFHIIFVSVNAVASGLRNVPTLPM